MDTSYSSWFGETVSCSKLCLDYFFLNCTHTIPLSRVQCESTRTARSARFYKLSSPLKEIPHLSRLFLPTPNYNLIEFGQVPRAALECFFSGKVAPHLLLLCLPDGYCPAEVATTRRQQSAQMSVTSTPLLLLLMMTAMSCMAVSGDAVQALPTTRRMSTSARSCRN